MLFARRENENSPRGYYDHVSSDDDILDIIYEQTEENVIKSFDVINDFDIS